MKPGETIASAFEFAYAVHRDQFRKGSRIPYITHAMAVAALVGEFGGSDAQIAAALLHDTVEDGDGLDTLAQLRDTFGDHVADLVFACSDAFVKPKPPWRERKQRFVEAMRTASPEVRLIVAADKLHNAMITLRDLRVEGDTVWQRFNGGREGSLWVYAEMVRALSQDWQHPILAYLAETVDALPRAAHDADLRGS